MAKRCNNYVNIRLDENLKKDFEGFCDNCEMTVGGAINFLVRNTIKEKNIPFPVTAAVTGVMGVYEGGERQSMRISVRIDKESREAFQAVCEEIGIPMGRIIKMFMMHCVKTGKFPF